MKKSIYMLNLLLSFFTLASSVWKAEYYVILLAAPKIWMLLLLVFFFPFVKSSFSNRNNEWLNWIYK